MSKSDKKHLKRKDQQKGTGKRTSFRTRAPFNREARIAQSMYDEAGMCTGRCFKFVLSSDPVPGHAARGVIDSGPGRLQGLYDPVPGRHAVQNTNDPVPGRGKAPYSDDPVPGRRMAHHVYDPVPVRQTMKDDLVPGHLEVLSSLMMKMTRMAKDHGKMWPSWHSNTRTKDGAMCGKQACRCEWWMMSWNQRFAVLGGWL